MNVEVKAIENEGTIIVIVGVRRQTGGPDDGRIVHIPGDWRMMHAAIEGLKIRIGSIIWWDGEAISEPRPCEKCGEYHAKTYAEHALCVARRV